MNLRQLTPCLAFACSTILALSAPSQAPVPIRRSNGIEEFIDLSERSVVTGVTGRGEQPQGAQDPENAAAEAAASERLAKWMTLVFDRRPSSVLEAWAAPELEPYDPSEEKKEIEPELRDLVIAEFGVDPNNVTVPAAEAEGAARAAAEKALAGKRLQRELEIFARAVTLSRWDEVAAFFDTFPAKQRKDAYAHFLRTLLRHPQTPQQQRVPANLQEQNRFTFEETLVLAGMAPDGFAKEQVDLLAPLVQRAMAGGSVVEEFVRLLGAEVRKPGEEQRLDSREAALLLSAIGQDAELGAFLPGRARAERDNDREALNLLARYYLARFESERREGWLEDAWHVTQAALAAGEVGQEEKQEALLRAVELAPKVSEELGPQWLEQSFTERPERGMEIIATIGGEAARGFGLRAQDTDYRSKVLQLQKTAVEALLKAAPQLAEQWRPTLALLASAWIAEAAYSRQYSDSTRFGPVMQRDQYGNIFWTDQRRGGGGQVLAIEPTDLVDAQPGAGWVALLDAELVPHFAAVSAQLFLKLDEYERAFPFIERLAEQNARKAKELADDFLRVWMRSNNPNLANSRTNSYMFVYGFNQRAAGIPLTRSKQERSLAELAGWVQKLRALPIGGVDQQLLSEAFVAAHSSAEVYQLATIEKVFGDIGALEPRLLGELLSKMRTNLATVWRRPDVQEENQTRRSEKEMLEEVAEGYRTALTLAEEVMAQQGEHWSLLALAAAIGHDMNNFANEHKRDSGFAERRKTAFALFERAAYDYVGRAPDLRIDRETLSAFDTWFYAAVGACDLRVISEETALAGAQLPRIRAALDALPDGSRERHLAMFANALVTRVGAVAPQIKVRYLEAGFEIVGDHPQAQEAKKTLQFYRDLTKELRLECVVDGATEVGTAEFGVRVDIVHTGEIERSSGGFAKYATNQNSVNYSINYGRPTEDYRDRFEENVHGALGEHFEVLSVTWNGEKMTSKRIDAVWRRTPYAWLLLKARGPEIDRIPAIQADFDFRDNTGYVIMPIGSSPVAIDASREPAEARPYRDLAVTQLLDERHSDEGKVSLEIKATAKGLVPDLDEFLELELPGFRVEKTEDQGSVVNKFAEGQDSVETERVWVLALAPAAGESVPASFRFGKPRLAEITAVYQRYADADLETVDEQIALHGGGTAPVPLWFWLALSAALAGYFVWFFTSTPGGRGAQTRAVLLTLPAKITPFSVLGLLREIEARAPLDAATKARLADDIHRIETCHFARGDADASDLEELARDWLLRAG